LSGPTDLEPVYRYHDGTKHHFDRFAPSLGYLDWASQPRPFRAFTGAPLCSLFPPHPTDPAFVPPRLGYDQLFAERATTPLSITVASLGHFLRHSLALSAWKVFKGSRWALRVNPSSGNLHPTEAYLILGALPEAGDAPGVWHYAADRHAIERRCTFDGKAWPAAVPADAFFIALTSIHWRESWKYGERAFRYCQHDVGHALAAISLSAALCGWRVAMLPAWPQRTIASITGIDRDEDYVEAEREEAACLLLVTREPVPQAPVVDDRLVEAVRGGRWSGRASQLSEDHVQWTFIDEVARATEDPGLQRIVSADVAAVVSEKDLPVASRPAPVPDGPDAAAIIVQRRSAVALDGASFTDRDTFIRMLSRTLPRPGAPWDALWWPPHIHLALFVHRVREIAPGLYLLPRTVSAVPRLKAAFHGGFSWTGASADVPLWLLETGDYRARSKRVSCDQDIAADGFFSLAMIADFDAGLAEYGNAFYRKLFWEAGTVGQVLYLEAEAAGARATGIGCFFDDPVHQMLGLEGHGFQSLYHFTVGNPVEDSRLTTEPGYPGLG
jgi:SagB-type dehydrogenase family enzyme